MPSPSFTTAFSAFHKELEARHIALRDTRSPLRQAITHTYRCDETKAVENLLLHTADIEAIAPDIQKLAHRLVTEIRQQNTHSSGVNALMFEFSLSSEEGIALMCLAEALLRIPDKKTADRLIADKIGKGDWASHLGASPSLFVNAASWGLLITSKLISPNSQSGFMHALNKLVAKGGEPLIRKGVDLAIRMLGNQFVTGQTIEKALKNSRNNESRGYRYSYDMLGEAALTQEDAEKYYRAYEKAIHAIGAVAGKQGIVNGPGISVKLSALHPRYTPAQRHRVMTELLPRLKALLLLAKHYNIGLNIDAEEADRLELSLDLIEVLAFDKDLDGFDGLGFVVQAYQKRCPFVIDYLIDLARRTHRKLMVRLVKGAYWDTEIKRAQVDGLIGYPVYTRKVYTDVSYLVCAQKLLSATDIIYPQFATHNAHTLATIYTLALQSNITHYEFQCLYGMGETLYDQVVGPGKLNTPCRIYAPVGSYETLLAYLVRRLLENGANSSFVNQIVDDKITIDNLITDPVSTARRLNAAPHPRIPLPKDLYSRTLRKNGSGLDFTDETTLQRLDDAFQALQQKQWQATPLLAITTQDTQHPPHVVQTILNPADHHDRVGTFVNATTKEVEVALAIADNFTTTWSTTLPPERAQKLLNAANLLEQHQPELLAILVREAGKSLPNAIAEIREAVDFLRYYSEQIQILPPSSHYQALGPVVCISPWNFPLAIFIGQISAALAAGNPVLAKPAEQTPLIAYRAITLLHEAGIPKEALQLLPGLGEEIGAGLTQDPRTKGVIFTGSTEVAHILYETLAKRSIKEGVSLPLIAETGGQNALIVDSSALAEQVVHDVLTSAFDSAGQRCSACRILCLQEDIADKTLHMLKGAMQELSIGATDRLSTDVGPVIDIQAHKQLADHIDKMRGLLGEQSVTQLALREDCRHNATFIPPTLIEIQSLSILTREVFGPVLHVLRYKREQLAQLVQDINAMGYGLTLGVHSRINETIDAIVQNVHIGNIYINRNIVGAVVGVQPFGGEGKSGTGPKAGGPLYLKRLGHDQDLPLDLGLKNNPLYANNDNHPLYANNDLPHVLDVSFTNETLQSLIYWAKKHGYEDVATLGEKYQQNSLLGVTLTLPGPTGECNTLSFSPRGYILCSAQTTVALLNQWMAVLATGNWPVMEKNAFERLQKEDACPKTLTRQITVFKDEETPANTNIDLRFVLVHGQHTPVLTAELINRKEKGLVMILATKDATPIPLWRLYAEHAICVNTTAAGGNASLMTLQE